MAETIREITVRRLEGFRGRGEVDLAQELAIPVPMEVICRILGIPDADVAMLQELTDTSVEREPGTNQPTAAGAAARDALDAYLIDARARRLARAV